MKVVVAGGGIGGLAAAIAISRVGHEVVVCERAGGYREVGAGIQISANAARHLESWGLGDSYRRVAVAPSRIVIRRWSDDTVLRNMTLGESYARRYHHPYTNVHRHDFLTVLARSLRSQSRVQVIFGADVVGVDQSASAVTLQLADGTAVEGDAVIGADGIHSAVRTALFGRTPSRFSGAVAYRALVPRELVRDAPVEVTNRLGPDSHVVTYFVGENASHLNMVCVVPESSWDVESWTERGSVADLKAAFNGWSEELTGLLDLVAEPVFRWALHDREPLDQWGRGRVTLLGDACHPMLPFMAQGACQAIEDAATLADTLASLEEGPIRSTDIEAALRSYEQRRRPRATKVQRLSWANRTAYHLPDGDAQCRRDDAYVAMGDSTEALDWLYGHDSASTGTQ